MTTFSQNIPTAVCTKATGWGEAVGRSTGSWGFSQEGMPVSCSTWIFEQPPGKIRVLSISTGKELTAWLGRMASYDAHVNDFHLQLRQTGHLNNWMSAGVSTGVFVYSEFPTIQKSLWKKNHRGKKANKMWCPCKAGISPLLTIEPGSL